MTVTIGRRELLAALGGAAVAWPLAARAQQAAMPVVGYLNSTSPNSYARYTDAFLEGLKSTGYVEGESVAMIFRWAEGQNDRLPALADDLVRNQVSVIVATGATASAVAAKAATKTIPIVFITGGDPVEFNLVDSFNRPGGNLTGVSFLANSLASKQLELLHQLAPGIAIIGVLVNPTNPTLAESLWKDAREAAVALGLQVRLLHASSEQEFATVFGRLDTLGTGALLIGADGFFTSRIELLAQLAIKHRLPTICSYREFSRAGGLISYGTSVVDAYRQVGVYTGKVLKGENPADLPIIRPTKFEFVINLKTARMFGLTVPLPYKWQQTRLSNEAPPVHHAARWRCGCVAARGARTAAGDSVP